MVQRSVLLLGVLVCTAPLYAAPPLTPEQLAARIDHHLGATHREQGIVPAAPASDMAYLRRLWLDLGGRIPTLAEARAFHADRSPDKRRRLVESLLQSDAHAAHFATTWRKLLLPEDDANGVAQGQQAPFEAWLRTQFKANVPYDRLVRDLLTVPFAGGDRLRPRTMAARREEPRAEASPRGFYLVKEARPENLASSVAQVFLGVRLECAQCHDHKTAPWTRQKFWGFAAFFAGIERGRGEEAAGEIREVFDRREIAMPNGSVVEASFLDDSRPRWRFNTGPRTTLADWITAPTNPYFARATVNRLWAHFFGPGLVEPVDDMLPENEPSHPRLLAELAEQFTAHGFDLRYLMRALVLSEAYGRTSVGGRDEAVADGRRRFERMAVKGMTPEQFFDSLATATGYVEPPIADEVRLAAVRGGPRAEFLATFADQGRPRTEREMAIPQALLLMNGSFAAERTRPAKGGTLAALLADSKLDAAGRVEALFLATLTRPPTAAETERFRTYVEGGGPRKDPGRALGDVLWALLNCPEFILNH